MVFLAAGGLSADLGWPYFGFLVASGVQLAWQVITVDIENPQNCLRKFKSNRDLGLLLLAGIVIARAVS
jgi:4-hydroxybenzoate polyprenyltransferase